MQEEDVQRLELLQEIWDLTLQRDLIASQSNQKRNPLHEISGSWSKHTPPALRPLPLHERIHSNPFIITFLEPV